MSRLDVCFVDDKRVTESFDVRVVDECEGEEWNVNFGNEWIATWSTEAEAEEHVRRIKAALGWDGKTESIP